jgi:phosphoribosylformylglycinamidine synthase
MTASTIFKFSPAEIKSEGLTLDECQMICDRLNREPNKAEKKNLFCFISFNI